MERDYHDTRSRLETYFDRTAHSAWAALTSDAPVSRIRQTVRQGRDAMRDILLRALPSDLSGARVLDAGCGAGQLSVALAERGAEVVAIDLSPRLIRLAEKRAPDALAERIAFRSGDMLDESFGRFDHVAAMDSLIHYRAEHIAAALRRLAPRTRGSIVFTAAPSTPLLRMMHFSGKLFPQADRAPAIAPVSKAALRRALKRDAPEGDAALTSLGRVASGFYISHAYSFAGACVDRAEARA